MNFRQKGYWQVNSKINVEDTRSFWPHGFLSFFFLDTGQNQGNHVQMQNIPYSLRHSVFVSHCNTDLCSQLYTEGESRLAGSAGLLNWLIVHQGLVRQASFLTWWV